ncbi:MAG: efflux RND transporter periplasmic adaptor subunit [bacterium]
MDGRGVRILKTLLIVAVVAGIGYAVWWRVQSEEAEEEGGGQQAAASEQSEAVEGLFSGVAPIPVKVAPTLKGTLVQTVHAEGRAKPRRQVRLMSQVAGPIQGIPIVEGDYVREGDLLVRIDDSDYRMALEEARSTYLQRQADYAARQDQAATVAGAGLTLPGGSIDETELDRVRLRYQQAQEDLSAGRITPEEFREIELEYEIARILAGKERGNILKAQLTQARIAVQRAERNLEQTRLRAPFSGYVADLKVDEGQVLGSGTEILTLLDTSLMRVEVDVLESEIAPIRRGRKARVEFTALPGRDFEASVVAVNPIIDPQTRTGKVTLELANPEGLITSGMFARSRIYAAFHEDVLMVPLEALVERDERTLVFGVEESEDPSKPDVVKWRYVQLGPRNDTHVVVLPTDNPHEGVREGMPVCVEGHVSLQHDSYVRVTEVISSEPLVP